MVRRKLELKPIAENSKRHTTFTKRRQGLFKKVREFCSKFDDEAAVITISKAGNLYGFGHPAVDTIVRRYLADLSSSASMVTQNVGVLEESVLIGGESIMKEKPQSAQLTVVTQQRISEATGECLPALDLAMEKLGFKELDDLEVELESIKSEAVARAREIVSSGKNTLDG